MLSDLLQHDVVEVEVLLGDSLGLTEVGFSLLGVDDVDITILLWVLINDFYEESIVVQGNSCSHYTIIIV